MMGNKIVLTRLPFWPFFALEGVKSRHCVKIMLMSAGCIVALQLVDFLVTPYLEEKLDLHAQMRCRNAETNTTFHKNAN